MAIHSITYLPLVIMIFIPKLHRNLIIRPWKQLFPQLIIQLFRPLVFQELDDRFVPNKELIPIAPAKVKLSDVNFFVKMLSNQRNERYVHGIFSISFNNLIRILSIPQILRGFHLQIRSFLSKRWHNWLRHLVNTNFKTLGFFISSHIFSYYLNSVNVNIRII